jgi:hypothetical protein
MQRMVMVVDGRDSRTHKVSKEAKTGSGTWEMRRQVLKIKAIPPPLPEGLGKWIKE